MTVCLLEHLQVPMWVGQQASGVWSFMSFCNIANSDFVNDGPCAQARLRKLRIRTFICTCMVLLPGDMRAPAEPQFPESANDAQSNAHIADGHFEQRGGFSARYRTQLSGAPSTPSVRTIPAPLLEALPRPLGHPCV